jgi:hypothetical protein
VLFCRDRDPAKEIWAGKRAGQEGAQDRYGADQAFSFGDINQQLPELLAEKNQYLLQHWGQCIIRPASRGLAKRSQSQGANRCLGAEPICRCIDAIARDALD